MASSCPTRGGRPWPCGSEGQEKDKKDGALHHAKATLTLPLLHLVSKLKLQANIPPNLCLTKRLYCTSVELQLCCEIHIAKAVLVFP